MTFRLNEDQLLALRLLITYLQKKFGVTRGDITNNVNSQLEDRELTDAQISEIIAGQRPKLQIALYNAVKVLSDQYLDNIDPWAFSIYQEVYKANAHSAIFEKAGLSTMMAQASDLNFDKLQRFSNNYAGIYVYARFSSQWEGEREKSILCGIMEIKPHKSNEKFLRCVSYSQNRSLARRDPTGDNHNKFSGVIFPFNDYFYEICFDEETGYPVFAANKNFKRRVPNFAGISMSRYSAGRMISARTVYRRLEDCKSLEDAKSYMKYITPEEFKQEFTFEIRDLENLGRFKGRTPLTSIE
ncbi:MAG: hypothetical protein COA69_08615 [Robiginitomaculum sp.]|nr:MAG: hypothetical protein COA69_08615 [Robiginitomaculum sp.]